MVICSEIHTLIVFDLMLMLAIWDKNKLLLGEQLGFVLSIFNSDLQPKPSLKQPYEVKSIK